MQLRNVRITVRKSPVTHELWFETLTNSPKCPKGLGNVMRTFWCNLPGPGVFVPKTRQSLVRRYVVWNVGPPGDELSEQYRLGDCIKDSKCPHNVAQARGPKIRPILGASCLRLVWQWCQCIVVLNIDEFSEMSEWLGQRYEDILRQYHQGDMQLKPPYNMD